MEGDKQTVFKDIEELLGVFFLLWVPPVTVRALKKEFDEWKEKNGCIGSRVCFVVSPDGDRASSGSF